MDQYLMNNITRLQRLAGILTLTETMELEAKNKIVESVDETITEAQKAYDVFLDGKKIDTVFDNSDDPAEVKKSLVDHDGLDAAIVVKLRESEDIVEEGCGCDDEVVAELEVDDSDDEEELEEAADPSDLYFVIQQKEGAFSWDDIDQHDTKEAATAELAKLKEKNPDVEYRITKHNDAIKEDYESPKNLWILKVAEGGSEDFQPQFSGTRQECVDEWRDTKKDYPKGSKHKIERHLEEAAPDKISFNVYFEKDGKSKLITSVRHMGVAEDEIEAYKKKDQYAGGEFTIKRVVKEAEETAEQIATRIMEFMAMGSVGAVGAVTDNQKLDYLNSPVENQGPAKKVTVRLPSAVRKVVNQRIKELNQAVDEFDDKGFNDKSVKQQAVDCLNQILDNLSSNDEEGLKNAQIYFTTLMSPLTDFFPPQLINWLGTAGAPWVKEGKEFPKSKYEFSAEQLQNSIESMEDKCGTMDKDSSLYKDTQKQISEYKSILAKKTVKESKDESDSVKEAFNHDFHQNDDIGIKRLDGVIAKLQELLQFVTPTDQKANEAISNWVQNNVGKAFWGDVADWLLDNDFRHAASLVHEYSYESGY